jgi:Putative beta-lactamase-inhibitor-like, PepSY-like
MKKLFFVVIAIMCSYATSFAQGQTPKAIVEAFNSKFPNATKVKWEKESDIEYEANFVLNGINQSANYAIDGKWLETESHTNFAKLPVVVQTAFNTNHKGAKVKAIACIENSKGETLYEIEVKKGLKEVEYFYNPDGTIHKE